MGFVTDGYSLFTDGCGSGLCGLGSGIGSGVGGGVGGRGIVFGGLYLICRSDVEQRRITPRIAYM